MTRIARTGISSRQIEAAGSRFARRDDERTRRSKRHSISRRLDLRVRSSSPGPANGRHRRPVSAALHLAVASCRNLLRAVRAIRGLSWLDYPRRDLRFSPLTSFLRFRNTRLSPPPPLTVQLRDVKTEWRQGAVPDQSQARRAPPGEDQGAGGCKEEPVQRHERSGVSRVPPIQREGALSTR